MRVYGVGLFLLLLYISSICCLECFSCNQINDPDHCNISIVCGHNEFCYLDGHSGSFSMGCAISQSCGADTASIIGRNIQETFINGSTLQEMHVRQTPDCHECCSTDGCNRQLCKHLKPTQCIDDETMDCAKLSTLFHICRDIHTAKSVCPKFCNLCNLVDGQWTQWTVWSQCDITCGKGTQTRTRTCTNPPPANGGLDCVGNSTEIKVCQKDVCPVHGGWSDWASWGACSVTCDIGLERRDRTCSNPKPNLFGDHCFGDTHEDKICYSKPCSDGGWSDWSSWGSCSETCGGGVRSQIRTCTNPKPSILGAQCVGTRERITLCNKQTCPDDTIAFTAYGIASSTQGMRFPVVLENYGGGYDNTTGVFTCSTPGLYHFSATLTMHYEVTYASLNCQLYVNKDAKIKFYTFKPTATQESFLASAAGSFHLNKNDTVYVGSCVLSYIINDKSTSFTGILVTPDM